MTRYEYRVLHVLTRQWEQASDEENLEATLNDAAAEGWRVVSTNWAGGGNFYATLEREARGA